MSAASLTLGVIHLFVWRKQRVAGELDKQIAAELGTVEKTIKFHRANLMRKMGVRVVADPVKLAERAGVGSTPGNWGSARYVDQGPVGSAGRA